MGDQNQGQDGAQGAPEKLVINGTEYDPTEAEELLGKGKFARELEAKWNSPIDSLASAYGKSQTELKATQAELSSARATLQQYEAKKDQGTETAIDTQKAREAARKLGFVLQEDIDKSYIKREDFDKIFEEKLTQREQVQKILSDASRLEKEIDGTDGRPAFNKKVVLAYANTYGHEDLQKAYEEMHADTIKAWQEKQLAEKKNPSLKTFKNGGGAKNPNRPKITDDNLGQALREVMGD